MKTLILILFAAIGCHINAQQTVDYLSIRSELVPQACGFRDSATLVQTRLALERLDTIGMKRNMHVYYKDLALAYYEPAIGATATDTAMIRKAIEAYHHALFHEPSDATAVWNLVFCYYRLAECDGVEKYLMIYMHIEKPRNRDKKAIKHLRSICNL